MNKIQLRQVLAMLSTVSLSLFPRNLKVCATSDTLNQVLQNLNLITRKKYKIENIHRQNM